MDKFSGALNRIIRPQKNVTKIKEWLPAQEQLLQFAPTKEFKSILIWGGTRSGKTVGVCFYDMLLLSQISNFTLILTATTQAQAMLTLGNTLMDLCQLYDVEYSLVNYFNHPVIMFPNGSIAIICGYQGRGIDNLLMGVPVDKITCDESRHLKDEQFAKCYSRLSGTCKYSGVQMLMLITNPEGIDSWIYKKYIKCKEGFNILFPPKDNEKNLPPGYFESMEKEIPKFMADRLIRSMWVSAEGAVFPNIKYENVFDNYKPRSVHSQWSGLDLGFNHQFAFVFWSITYDKLIYVHDTYLTSQSSTDIQASNIKNIVRRNRSTDRSIYCSTDHDPQNLDTLDRLINGREIIIDFNNADKRKKGYIALDVFRLFNANKIKFNDTPGNQELHNQLVDSTWDSKGDCKILKDEGIADDALDAFLYSFSPVFETEWFYNFLNINFPILSTKENIDNKKGA